MDSTQQTDANIQSFNALLLQQTCEKKHGDRFLHRALKGAKDENEKLKAEVADLKETNHKNFTSIWDAGHKLKADCEQQIRSMKVDTRQLYEENEQLREENEQLADKLAYAETSVQTTTNHWESSYKTAESERAKYKRRFDLVYEHTTWKQWEKFLEWVEENHPNDEVAEFPKLDDDS